jgi:hypothetical protein
MTRIPRMTDTLRGKTLVYLGAGLALAGAGAATAVAGFSTTQATAAGATYDSAARASVSATTVPHHRMAPRQASHAGHAGHAGHADHAGGAGHASHAGGHTRVVHVSRRAPHHTAHRADPKGWGAVSKLVAAHTIPRASHGKLIAADRLTPVGTSGPQAWMPITAARYDNAKIIVRRAIAKKMGLRAAVIAVAAAMQESTLLNLPYGGVDSLGLFQQRPSAGWGTPQEILHPTYAADAFLNALHGYQGQDPYWARQPLWQAAQGVQGSAFPYAYAKWEAQAASLVASVTKHLV